MSVFQINLRCLSLLKEFDLLTNIQINLAFFKDLLFLSNLTNKYVVNTVNNPVAANANFPYFQIYLTSASEKLSLRDLKI